MKTIDVLCEKCNKWHFNLEDNGSAIFVCINCLSEIPHPKRRPKTLAADVKPRRASKVKSKTK